jgi:DNA-binding NarL/FixJ family response regulator
VAGYSDVRVRRCHHQEMVRTVLVVDDHDAFRESVRALLEAAGYDVVGTASNGAEALTETRRLHPSVVLLDVMLPDADGIDVATELAELADAPVVVLTSTREAAMFGARLGTAPALGFIAKDELSGPTLSRLLG